MRLELTGARPAPSAPSADPQGRLPGTQIFRSSRQYPEVESERGLLVLRIDSPIWFANVEAGAWRRAAVLSRGGAQAAARLLLQQRHAACPRLHAERASPHPHAHAPTPLDLPAGHTPTWRSQGVHPQQRGQAARAGRQERRPGAGGGPGPVPGHRHRRHRHPLPGCAKSGWLLLRCGAGVPGCTAAAPCGGPLSTPPAALLAATAHAAPSSAHSPTHPA